jgi:hypothetical protein
LKRPHSMVLGIFCSRITWTRHTHTRPHRPITSSAVSHSHMTCLCCSIKLQAHMITMQICVPSCRCPLTLAHRVTSVAQKGSGVPSEGLSHQLPSHTSFTYTASTAGGSFTWVSQMTCVASAWTTVCMQSMLIAWISQRNQSFAKIKE